jgi:hypothetical protein
MNAQQARRRREAARARQAAGRRRERRIRLGMAALLAAVLVAGIGGLAVTVAGRHRQAAASPGSLAGLQTGPAPWGANTADLAQRLQATGVAPLNPVEGTAVHIHQHLDLYVDGHKVLMPAGIGIDPAVGYAPLHTHDPSGILHVESPTVRTYTLGQFFAVWGVRFTPSCLGGYCTGGGRQLRVYVNGQLVRGDPTAVTLAAHQELVVAFGTAAQLPSPVPASRADQLATPPWKASPGPAPPCRTRAPTPRPSTPSCMPPTSGTTRPAATGCCRSARFPADLASGRLPSVVFVMPNLRHEMHSGPVRVADRRLQRLVDQLQASPVWQQDTRPSDA